MKFSTAPESSIPEVQPSKKQKGNKVAKEKRDVQVDLVDTPTLENRLKVNVMTKAFPYSEFMDKELMTPTTLEGLEGDKEDLLTKFQWMGHMLLKLVTILRYSEPTMSSGARVAQEKKDREEKLAILQNEELA